VEVETILIKKEQIIQESLKEQIDPNAFMEEEPV